MQDMIELKERFQAFIRENKWIPWLVVISVAISYGGSLAGLRIGIDSEANMNMAEEFLNSWYSIGRFSLVFIKRLTGLSLLNPLMANILMIAMMICYGIFADFMFYDFSGNHKSMKTFYVIFPALFLTHPVFAQQYIFTVQAFEVAFCMLLCLLAVYFISRWSFEGKRGFLYLGLLLAVFSFGGYQAFVPFYMSAALAVYLVYYYFHDNCEKGFFLRSAVRQVLAFGSAYLLYQLTVKLVMIWKNGTDFQGIYLEKQVLWGQHSPQVCFGTIKHYMGEVILGKNLFYPKTFLLFSILFAVHLLYYCLKKRRKDVALYGAAAFGLVLSPFYLSIYQGAPLLMRSQFSLPFTAAFFAAAAVTYILKERKALAAGAAAVCLLISLNQGAVTSRCLLSAQMAYEHDKVVAQQIIYRMHTLNSAAKGQRIAIIGQYQPVLPEAAGIRKETIGFSFFEWDFAGSLGVTKRGAGFLKVLGFPYEQALPAEYEAAKAYSLNMPDWPAEGSVQKLGEVVVIRFSGY